MKLLTVKILNRSINDSYIRYLAEIIEKGYDNETVVAITSIEADLREIGEKCKITLDGFGAILI